MADISITAASVLAGPLAQFEPRYNFGATVTAGMQLYLDDNQLWQPYDANPGIGGELTRVRGIALNGGANGQPARVNVKDPDFTPGGTLTPGSPVYASITAGGITHDAQVTGAYPVIMGIAKSATKMNLNPTASGAVI